MKKYLLSVLFLLAMFVGMRAQTNIANYTFAKSVGTYTPLTGATTFTNNWDSETINSIPLGGTFTYGGVTFTTCNISANGFITFGGTPSGTSPLSAGTYSGAISAFAQDGASSTASGATPSISYMNVGGATGEFVIQYADHANYWNRSTERLNFQIRLNLVSGVVNIVYGPWTAPGSSSSGITSQIGIRGATTTYSNNVNNVMIDNIPSGSSCNWQNVVTGYLNNSSVLFSSTNNVVVPVNGLTFSWAPPAVAIAPVRFFSAVTGITQTSANVLWTAPSGATQYNIQYRIPGTCSWTSFSGNPVMTNSVSLTGLASSTNYQVRVQATDGTNTTIWSHIPDAAGTGDGYTTTGTFKTLSPPCTSPTSQPSNLIFGAATTTSVGATFAAATPTVTNYLVVRTLGTTPTAPVDGTTYTVATAALGGTVVSIGTGTTISSTGLTGNTNYSYYVYAYNNINCTGGPLYNPLSPLTGTVVTCVSAPGTGTVSGTTQTAFNLTFGSSVGGGASPVTYTVDVATNNTFASPVAGSPFVVTAPTNSISVSGLTAGTQYYYRMMASNGCNSAYTTTATVTTLNVPCVAPTAQATGLTLGGITSAVINGTFTAATPTVSGYLVVRTLGSAPTAPVNGTPYTSGTAALGGTITAVGTGTTFATTSLTGNTNYSYYIYSYNNTACSGGPVYNAASPLTGTAVTCVSAPGTGTVSGTTQTAFNLTFGSSVGGGANPVTYTVDVATNNTFASPVAGSPFVVTAPTNSISVSGLTAGTQYFYRMMASNGCNSAYTTTATVTTLNLPCVAPTAQASGLVLGGITNAAINGTFTAVTSTLTSYLVVRTTGSVPTNPVDGTLYTSGTAALGGTIAAVGTSTTFANTGLTGNTNYSYYVFTFNNTSCVNGPLYNTTSPLTGTATTCPARATAVTNTLVTTNSFNLSWTASAGGTAATVTYSVEVSTNAGFTAPIAGSPFLIAPATLSLSLTGLNPATTYYYRVIADNGCNIGGTTSANVTTSSIATDLQTVQLIAPVINSTNCYASSIPVVIQLKNVGTTTLDFTTNNATINTSITGTNPQTFTTVVNTGTLAANATRNYTVTATYNMSAVGVYTFNATSTLATPDANTSNDAMAAASRTTTSGAPLPYSEGFLTTTSPTGWTTAGWSFGATHGVTTNGIYANYDGSGDPTGFDLLRLGTISGSESLSFDYRLVNFSGYPATATPNSPAWGNILIQVSTDCGATFATIHTIDPSNHIVATTWATKQISLSAFAGQNIIIRVLPNYSAGDIYIDMDNFNIASCFTPLALNASNTTTTGTDLTWTAPTIGSPSDYIWEIRTSGAAGSGATGLVTTGTVTAPSTSVTASGLTLSTNYSVYVQSHCGGTDYSVWSPVKTFTTPAACPVPVNLTISNVLGHTAVATWTVGATETAWDVYYGSSPLTPPTATTVPTATTSATSYSLSGLNAVTGYSVYVRANCGSGSYSAWTAVKAFTTTVSCPVPTNVTLSAITPTTAVATWTAGGLEPSWFVKYSAPTTTATVSTPSYSLTGLTPSTTYSIQVRGYCGVADTSSWTTIKTFMTPCLPPNITSTIPGTRCGIGTTTLGATADPGATIQWYTAPTGGTSVATGTVYTTPSINTSTNYYVTATSGASTLFFGPVSPTAEGGTISSSSVDWQMNFDVIQNTTIASVDIFPTAAIGSVGSVKITTSADVLISDITYTTTVTGGNMQTISLNVPLTPGTGYKIRQGTAISLNRNTSAAAYPYTSSSINITGNGFDQTYYYYFYNWSVSTGCESSRMPVAANVTAPPVLSLTTGTTVCANVVSTVSLTSTLSNYDSYIWSPTTNLYTDAAATIAYTGGTATAVYYKSGVNGSTTYNVNASNSGTGCANIATTTMGTQVPPIIASVTPSVVCSGDNVNLNATTNIVGSGTLAVGTGTNVTGNTDQLTAFCNRFSTYRMQAVYTAAELTAAGLRAGNITSIAYNISTIGSAANTTSYTVKCGTVTASVLTDYVASTGFTTVYNAATQNHAIGLNTITFSTPFNWDGVSNLVVEVSHAGINSSNNANTYYTVTTGNKQVYGINGAATGTPTSNRLNIIFGGQIVTQGAGGLNWQWNPGAINTNTAVVNPVNTGSTPSVSMYTITGTDPLTTCSGSAAVSVTVNPLPAAPVAVNSSQCGVAIPTASLSGGTSYKWYATSTSTTVLQAGASATYTTSINTTTTWHVSSFNGTCESPRVMVTASVTIPDAVTATSTQTAICPGQSFILTANHVGTTNTYNYTWTAAPATGSGIVTSVTGATTSVMPTAPGNYAYLLTAVDGSCTATASISVVTNAPPVISATASPTMICSGSTATLSAGMPTSAPLGTGTSTTSGSGAAGGSYISPYSHFFGGYKGQYILRASELTAAGLAAGNISSLALNITSVGTTYNGFSISMGATTQTVMTTAFVSPLATVFGTTNVTPVVGINTYNFASPFVWDGTSNVIIQITWSNNNGGGTASEVAYNTQSYAAMAYYRADNQTPVAMAGQTTASGTVNSRPWIRLTGSNPGSLAWQWNPGAVNSNTVVVNPTAGTTPAYYSYTVTATDPLTTCSTTAALTLTVNPSVTVTAVSSSSAICSGNTTTLTAGGATTYSWIPAGGTSSVTTVTPSASTIYTVTGTSLGCSDSKTVSINVTATPTIIASSSPAVICAGSTVTLNATGAANYTWTPVGVMTASTIVTPTTTTVYSVTGVTSGCASTKTVNVTVNNIPVINLNPLATICTTGGSATLTATGTSTAYVWSNGPTTATNVVTPSAPTVYTVTGTNNCGINTATTSVVLGSAPTVSASTSAPTICNNNSAVITASGTATSYTWSTGATTQSITVTPTITTLYIVTGTNACGTASATVVQNVSPCTGLEETFNSDAVSIYPNPANEYINIAIPASLTTNTTLVEVTDALGKLVMKETLNTDVTTIRLDRLEDGVYFFKVISNNQTVKVGKVVKH